MKPYAVALNFNNTPFLIFGGIVGAFLLLMIAARIIEWRKGAQEREAFRRRCGTPPASFDAAQRLEAMKLMERIGAVRA